MAQQIVISSGMNAAGAAATETTIRANAGFIFANLG